MVLLAIRGSTACQLFNQYGWPIGTVVQPVSDYVVGRGAGTVLLNRCPGQVAGVRAAERFGRELDLTAA